MLRRFFQIFWIPLYRRWGLRQMERTQKWAYAGLKVQVPPGVFHPGLFFSTPIFIDFLQKTDFQQQKTLDVGTGSGLLALFTAKKGANATALDINPLACETARQNAADNGLVLRVLESDLFGQIPAAEHFDFILVNPPYYPKKPADSAEHAFFAGENLEYFEHFFRQLPACCHAQTRVWMILSEDCDFEKIKTIAGRHRADLSVVFEKRKWGERLFVAQVLVNQYVN